MWRAISKLIRRISWIPNITICTVCCIQHTRTAGRMKKKKTRRGQRTWNTENSDSRHRIHIVWRKILITARNCTCFDTQHAARVFDVFSLPRRLPTIPLLVLSRRAREPLLQLHERRWSRPALPFSLGVYDNHSQYILFEYNYLCTLFFSFYRIKSKSYIFISASQFVVGCGIRRSRSQDSDCPSKLAMSVFFHYVQQRA